jgi:hypothetical protein
MTRTDQDEARIPCWFCARPLSSGDVLRDGILRGRPPAQGGPYRILPCPNCDRHNLCEKTPKGRWFASPNVRLSALEYLFSQLLAPAAEDFLVAVSWFRDNEERRRIFFERDGDRRYVGKNFLLRLWPTAKLVDAPSTKREGNQEREQDGSRQQEQEQARQRQRARARERQKQRHEKENDPTDSTGSRQREKRQAPPRPRPRIVTPYELLGIGPEATKKEIHAAFQRLALHYHPDKVYHLGEEFRDAAHEKFTELKEAYEALLRRRTRDEDG